MITLILFAFLSGIITTISPCILPVLPLLLSAGIGQGRYRPYGIIVGLIISFTFFTLTLTALVRLTGVSPDVLRYISLGLIIFFGLTLIFPPIEQLFSRLTAPLAQLGNKVEGTNQTETGFIPGFILGTALGLIWAPCAGPILATITTLVATESVTLSAIAATFAYSCGTALPMFFIMYGGNKVIASIGAITPYAEVVRKVFGALMILTALAIAFHFDVIVQQLTLKYFPTIQIEDNPLVKKELDILQSEQNLQNTSPTPIVGGTAPDFVKIVEWINSPKLSIQDLNGKLVLVDFWTYSCINCVRTLPYLKKWYDKYKDKGFVIVGIHTPEFEFEKNASNVKSAIERFGITYPVALDNNYATWKNYHNRYWPAHYLIDQHGIIRDIHHGEGKYLETENMIRSLIGLPALAEHEKRENIAPQTPEIYLGYKRAENYVYGLTLVHDKATEYNHESVPNPDSVGLKGDWLVSSEFITSESDTSLLSLNFMARHVYAVMASTTQNKITILLDGKIVPADAYTTDMNENGEILVKESRMYKILDLKDDERHTLTIKVPKGASLYTFTFGG